MAKIIAKTANMSREEWLKHRLDGIGGSDAAAIAGANPYKSPIVCYMEKTGIYNPPEPGEPAYWGNVLEEVVASEFVKRYNLEIAEKSGNVPGVRVQRRNAIFAHDQHDFMRANVDRLIYCPFKGKGILEVKTANQFLSDEWAGEDVPNQYYLQLQHYIAILGVSYGYMAVLIGGQKYKHYYIERDEEIINYLISIERDFWENNVKAKIPPEIDGADSTTEMLKILYPDSQEAGMPLELPSESVDWAEKVEEYKQRQKDLKKLQQEFENKLKNELKENEIAFAGAHQIKWKKSKNGQRRFTIKLGAAVQ